MSLFLALLLVKIALPLFGSLSGKPLKMGFAQIPWLIPGFICIALFVGLAAGSYPALVLAGFQPVNVIKGNFVSGHQKSSFRKVLVVAQLAISTFLIIGSGIIFRQINFMKNKNLGFEKERVLVLRTLDNSVRNSILAVKQELKNVPGVINVTASSHIPGWEGLAQAHLPEDFSMEESQTMRVINADPEFLDTLGIKLAEGRNFSRKFPNDPQNSVLINETAAIKFGWKNPLGKKIQEIYGSKRTRVVIGVLEDFHMSSLHDTIEPLYINNMHPQIQTLSLRLSPGDIAGTLNSIKSRWKSLAPNTPFDYFFLDDSFDSQYRSEEKLSRIFSYFSLLAVFVACLGLFGMACYTAEQRIKEIGIRKVLGASSSSLVMLLYRELIRLFIIANILSWPIIYLASQKWLQNFAYRTSMGIDIFLLSAVLIFIVSFGTVSYHAVKTALANPVESLRYE
jgi:putative ABC transport system permease protein